MEGVPLPCDGCLVLPSTGSCGADPWVIPYSVAGVVMYEKPEVTESRGSNLVLLCLVQMSDNM